MTSFKFEKFGGELPIYDERLLPIENASYIENAFLQSGSLEPLAADIEIHTLANPIARYAYRVPFQSPGIDYLRDSYWLEFEDPNTTVVRSTTSTTTDGGRFYWASPSGPPGYTTKARIEASLPPLILGIPRPAVAPGVTVSGGATPTQTRAYVYTWLSSMHEEGQPSPPTVVTGNVTGTWHITMTAPTGLDTANRSLAFTRIYRTETGLDGSVAFFFVVELPIATLTYDDTISGDIVASSEIMQSDDWSGPPQNLQGIESLPNGMVAGWTDTSEVWFCEPFRPHAWPVKYMVTVDAPIVGFGSIDQNLMILTAGQPYVAMGIHPSVVALRKVQPVEPCTAQGSIVATPQGVLYTSNNGLILIGPSGGRNLTQNLIRKDQWLRLINLKTIHATYFMAGYYCYSGRIEGVFQDDTFQMDAFQNDDFTGTMIGAHIALEDDRLGYMTLTCDSPTDNVMLDQWTGETLVIRNSRVYHVDRREYLPRQSYKWRSKLIQLLYKENMAAAKIFYDEPRGSPPVAAVPTVFRMFVDGRLRYTRTVPKSGEQFRLPSGYEADTFQFELEGQLLISNLQVATSARELRQV